MALAIIIVVIVLMCILAQKGKTVRHQKYPATRQKRTMTRQETDELITVILPTINNHK